MLDKIEFTITIGDRKFGRVIILEDPMEFSRAWENMKKTVIEEMFPEIIGYLRTDLVKDRPASPRRSIVNDTSDVKINNHNGHCVTCSKRVAINSDGACCICRPHSHCIYGKEQRG